MYTSTDPAARPTHPEIPATIDLLDQALALVRRDLNRSFPVRRRIRIFWAGVVAARKTGAADIVADAFMELAETSGLKVDLGWHADEDLRHVIRWGLFNRNPFGRAR
jgi:hypothetical protein